jgi:DNA-cytosine methyltransferase
MRVGSLFSGIGGMEYGLERSGLSTSCEWMIEMDEYCCSVLEKNFPNTLVLNNKVEDINPLDLPEIDILTAGFPCQPVSVAGSRKGVTDERWLWDEVWRFIDVLRPRYFILENVPGIFTANKGKAFERVIKDIAESRSYRFEWQVISARTVGAAHLRKRFFGVGTLGNTEHNGSSQSENRESIGERTISWRQGEEVQEKINRESKGESQDNPILNTEIKSSNETNQQTSSISKSREARLNIGAGYGREQSRVDRETAELWMGSTAYGFPRWMARLGLVNVWTGNTNKFGTPLTSSERPSIKRIIEGNNPKKQLSEDPKVYFDEDYDMWEIGMPRSMENYEGRKEKLTALGNAVVPQCVELVGRLIKRADELGTMVFDVEIEESI